MPWEIDYRSGVQQDAKGRKFRIAKNSRGRQDIVYVQEQGDVPVGYTVPAPIEKKPAPRKKLTTKVEGPKRLHVVEVRWRAGEPVHKHEFSPSKENEPLLELLWNALWISPDCGQTWKVIGNLPCEYHVQYHIDEEKQDAQA